ncbi:hypothetical protein QOT17_000902 [Balamuthia mandrillaris]
MSVPGITPTHLTTEQEESKWTKTQEAISGKTHWQKGGEEGGVLEAKEQQWKKVEEKKALGPEKKSKLGAKKTEAFTLTASTGTREPISASEASLGVKKGVHVTERGSAEFTSTTPSRVEIKKVEVDHSEELQRLSLKIAKEKEELLKVTQDLEDHLNLKTKEEWLATQKEARAEELEKAEKMKLAEKNRLMREEQELEARRAAAHKQAVQAENERAELEAGKVLALKEAQNRRKLLMEHAAAAKHAQDLQAAHNIALQELEKRKRHLEENKEYDVEVRGVTGQKTPKPIDIEVDVKPNLVPEAKIIAGEVPEASHMRASILEKAPEREQVHIPVEAQKKQTIRKEERIVLSE